jgi:lipopolysaccharide assembly outer membrane protein LptD (OstA)
VRAAAGRDTTFVDGHVVFHSGATLLRADRGVFVGATRVGRFEGRVEILHEGRWLLGPVALLDEPGERLEFPGGVLVVDGGRTIVAREGAFDLAGETAAFRGDLGVIEGRRAVEADSFVVLGDDEAEAVGRVAISDAEERIRAAGERAQFRPDRVRLTGGPSLARLDARGEVESEVWADTLLLHDPGTAEGLGQVRIERAGTVAEGARARIDSSGARATLDGAPRALREGRALAGDRIVLALDGSALREVLAEGNARLTRDEEVREEGRPPERALDTVLGDSIRLEVEADTLRRAVVWGDTQSRTERFGPGEELLEWNEVSGDTLVLYTDAGGAERVRVIGSAAGVYLPRPDERPARAESAGAGADSLGAAAAADSLRAAHAAPSDSSALVRYGADAIDFLADERRIALTRGATVRYQGMELRAGEILYDLRRMTLVAAGEPVLRQGGEEVAGRQMSYNLDAAKGIVYGGRTAYETGFLDGGEVARIDPSTLDVRGGSYTSCDRTPPHYHLSSRLMRVYLDDKTVARPVVLHIRRMPIVALPFYIMPMAHGRRSGFLLPAIEFGLSERRGRFIRNLGYYWATNDYMDFAFTGDFYQNERWTARLEANYAVRYLLSGRASGTYSRETVGGSRRYDVQADHRQQLGEGAQLTARADFASDERYRSDIGGTVQDLNRELKSDVAFSKRWTSQSLTLNASRREALDRGDVTERLPDLRYTVSRFPILGGGAGGDGSAWYGTTYLGLGGSVVNARDTRVVRTSADTTTTRTVNFATEESVTLSNSMKLFGWLGLSPSAEYREALFDEDLRGERWTRRGVWSARAGANTNLYGTWWPRTGPLVGVRHIVTPGVSFGFTPDFDAYAGRFPSISGIGGTPSGAQSLGLSLQQTFQMKVRSGGTERSIDDLVVIGNSISRNLEGGPNAWSRLSTSVRLRPAQRYEVTVSTSHSVTGAQKGIESISIINSASLDETIFGGGGAATGAPGDTATGAAGERAGAVADARATAARGAISGRGGRGGWTLGVVHRYVKGRPGTRADQNISFDLGTRLSRGWRIDYSPFLDLREREVISQRFTLVRDLHCWEARFSGVYDGRDWEYFFKISVRAHPDIGYERGRKVF